MTDVMADRPYLVQSLEQDDRLTSQRKRTRWRCRKRACCAR